MTSSATVLMEVTAFAGSTDKCRYCFVGIQLNYGDFAENPGAEMHVLVRIILKFTN
mgnify:CR=1 FL=1